MINKLSQLPLVLFQRYSSVLCLSVDGSAYKWNVCDMTHHNRSDLERLQSSQIDKNHIYTVKFVYSLSQIE